MAVTQGLTMLALPHADIFFSYRGSQGGDCVSATRCPSIPAIWCCVQPRRYSGRHVSPAFLSRRQMMRENLWREFFRDPSQWWDHRSEKVNPRYPDFKHKRTQQSLWLADNLTPAWVESELVAMAPRLLQSHIFSWHVKLRRHVKAADYEMTLTLFQQMQREGMILDEFTFVPVLNACSSLKSLEEGRRVHDQIAQRGCESDVYVATCLVDMYAKCGSIEDAWIVFNNIPKHNVVSWSVMIRAYVKCGQGLKALELFRKMHQEGVEPNAATFVGVLNACASVAALEEGRRVHTLISQRGFEFDISIATCLVDMYAKCGSMGDAWSVFIKLRERDVVSWNAIIGGYVKSEQGLQAIKLFQKMQEEGVKPDSVTFVQVLNACSNVAALETGRHIHAQISQRGWESHFYITNSLIAMYAKCGSIKDAWSVFNNMQERDVVSWSAMIGGYVKSGQGRKAMELFEKMQQEGVEPNTVTFVGVLNACASVASLEGGRRVHEQIIRRGSEPDICVANSLIDMYAKCGSIEDAWGVFNKMRERDVVSWNAMIGVYVKAGQALKAVKIFQWMQQEGVEPDNITFIGVLNACASVRALEEGRYVHSQINRRGYDSYVHVATCLVDMYAKCGSIEDAWNVFAKMQVHDRVSWNVIVGGYVKSGQGLKAIALFQHMQQEGVEPDPITFVGVLNACASIAALEEGRHVHTQIIQRGCESDVYVATCLVDMYAKCGSTEDAWSVFNKMQQHDVVSWSAMIGCYVKSGQGLKAMELFRKMQQAGVRPDAITFVGVLDACASVAALEEGKGVHQQIIQGGLESVVSVANCLVDMYAKCGSIDDAWIVFKKIAEPNVVSWSAMIGGYAMHGYPKKAIGLFKRMGKEGLGIDEIIFTCLLSACSHGGLVKEGLRYFYSMTSCYNVSPTIQHYACMIDLLGRSGQLEEAEEITMRMPMDGDTTLWMSLLGACRIHGNIEMAERAAKQCWVLDPDNASGHVLLSNLYAVGKTSIRVQPPY